RPGHAHRRRVRQRASRPTYRCWSGPMSRPVPRRADPRRPVPVRPVRRRLAAGGPAAGRLVRGALPFSPPVGLVGLVPRGRWDYVGWPLPHHVPSWDEISTRLTGPMDDTLLLDILTVILWPLWAAFAISLLRAAPGVVHEARWPGHGPARPARGMRGLATV